MHYSVEDLNGSNVKDWNTLVEVDKQGSFYHTLTWKNVADHFNKTKYFLVYRDNEALALCPLKYDRWSVKNLFSWGELSNLEDAPLIISDPNDAQISREIISRCKQILSTEHLSFVSLNLSESSKDCFKSMGLPSNPMTGAAAGNMTLNLQEYSPQRIWQDLFRKHERRKAELLLKEGWAVDEMKSDGELENFYAYFKMNMEHLRLANYPRLSFFKYLKENLTSREMLVFLLRRNGIFGGGLLVFLYEAKETMYYAFLASNRNVSTRYSPGFALFWHGIKKATEIGYTNVVFGGTHNDPSDVHYRIKAKFGCRFELRYRVNFPRSHVLINSGFNRLASICR